MGGIVSKLKSTPIEDTKLKTVIPAGVNHTTIAVPPAVDAVRNTINTFECISLC